MTGERELSFKERERREHNFMVKCALAGTAIVVCGAAAITTGAIRRNGWGKDNAAQTRNSASDF